MSRDVEDDTPRTLYRADLLATHGCHRLRRGAVHFAGTSVISGYYVKASLLVAVYLMLGGSNRDYYRVRVSARTALTSTAILTLTLGAATARERAVRPTVATTDRRFDSSFFLFFFLSVIRHLSRRVLSLYGNSGLSLSFLPLYFPFSFPALLFSFLSFVSLLQFL